MKKVLLISFNFPPHTTIGAQRPYRLSKYFPQYGWEPIVLTPKLPGKPPDAVRVIETDYHDIIANLKSKVGLNPEKGLHEELGIATPKDFNYPTWKSKTIKFLKEVINFPDDGIGWYKSALKSASELLSNEKVDAIISTSPPMISHLIARKLKQKHRIPWIADLRDLWTQNHFYNKFTAVKFFERRLELKTLSDADAIVTVTQRFADNLKGLHKDKQIYCLTNGFDPDDYRDEQTNLTKKFTITYTGGLYNGRMDPSLLFEAVSKLIEEKSINRDLLEIRFYSRAEEWLTEEIKKYNLEGVVHYYGFLPREEVLKKQKESQLLLLLLDNTNKEVIYYPAKVFEYFGAKRSILALGRHGGIVKELLEKNNAGIFIENYELLKNILLKYYNEFIESGEVKCLSNNNIENYGYDIITRKYSEILDEMVCI